MFYDLNHFLVIIKYYILLCWLMLGNVYPFTWWKDPLWTYDSRSKKYFDEIYIEMDNTLHMTPISNALLRKSCHLCMLFTGREVCMGKNCTLGLEHGPRSSASGRAQDRGYSFSQYGRT